MGDAKLYGVETKRVNEAVRNNQDKFLEDFYFELTDKEFEILRSKDSTAKFAKLREFNKHYNTLGKKIMELERKMINSSKKSLRS